MDEMNREGPLTDDDYAADRERSWSVDHAALWSWIAEALEEVGAPAIDHAALTGLCLHVLDTHAPAALVHAHAGGIALERLVAARLTEAYADQAGHLLRRYALQRLRSVARTLHESAIRP